jgi:hypothetical protein
METQYRYILEKIEEEGWTITPCEECRSWWWAYEILILQKGRSRVYLTFIIDGMTSSGKPWCAGISEQPAEWWMEARSDGLIDLTGGWKDRVEDFIRQLNALHK